MSKRSQVLKYLIWRWRIHLEKWWIPHVLCLADADVMFVLNGDVDEVVYSQAGQRFRSLRSHLRTNFADRYVHEKACPQNIFKNNKIAQ